MVLENRTTCWNRPPRARFLLLLIGVYTLSSWAMEGHILHGLQMGLFLLAVFGCIVLHELGHALAAKRFGISTHDITLLPIGGVARLARMPEEPKRELLIAAAGPMVSFGLGLGFYGTDVLLGGRGGSWLLGGALNLVSQLAAANMFLALFNLLPALPMDGGRILRAAFASRLGRRRATEIASKIGKGAALVFGVVELFINPVFLLIAVFIWFGATQEARFVSMQSLLRNMPASGVMRPDVRVLAPTTPLGRAAALFLRTGQREFAIVERQRLLGILTRDGLLHAVAELGADAPVWLGSSPDCKGASADDSAWDIFERMRMSGQNAIPVTVHGAFAGMRGIEDFDNVALVNHALAERCAISLGSGKQQEPDRSWPGKWHELPDHADLVHERQ